MPNIHKDELKQTVHRMIIENRSESGLIDYPGQQDLAKDVINLIQSKINEARIDGAKALKDQLALAYIGDKEFLTDVERELQDYISFTKDQHTKETQS